MQEIALDLIHAASGMLIPLDKVTLGTPLEVDPRKDLPTDPNTFLPTVISDAYDMRFPGGEGFLYYRLPLSLLVPDARVVFVEELAYPITTHELLSDINEIFHTQLTKKDLLNDTYLSPNTPIHLRAAPESLVWRGETYVNYNDSFISGRLLENGDLRMTEAGTGRAMEQYLQVE